MRSLLFGCVLGLALAAPLGTDAAAQRRPVYPWCAFYNVADGITECFYFNVAQCRASVSGVGGFCYENPAYVEPPPPARRPRAHRRHRH